MKEWNELVNIIETLRSPDGCAWDREQTANSLLPSVVEEAYELVDAVNNDDVENAREELGDLSLLVVMIAQIFKEENKFSIQDVIQEANTKLVRRHPHVFGDTQIDSVQDILHTWDEIKKEEKIEKAKRLEKKHEPNHSILSNIPQSFPPLEKAFKLQKKAAKVGFDWDKREDVLEKLHEEISEFQQCDSIDEKEEELGDILFSVVNLCRFEKIDPTVALSKTNIKFTKRFQFIEKALEKNGKDIDSVSVEEMELLWQKSKSIDL